jgi:putative serine protease PepD
VAATFAAGAGGVLVGAQLADDGTTGATTSAAAAAGQTVSTQPGPVSGDSAEPAAAVAEALSPAVVQINTGQGLGSGFIYDESGLILTAAHVTSGATEVEVRLADGSRLAGPVIGSDDSTDVAVVKVAPSDDLPVAVLATGVELQVGQLAVAIGSPFGLDQTVTAGIVSAIGRSTQTPGGVIPAIQTDAPINSGNSGGALADRQGRVIGINDSIITGSAGSTGSGNVGIGFAIPIDIAKAVADRIVAGESTDAGFLGVEGADATGSRAGAAITSVQAGSPAAEAGVTAADVVTAVDGRKVSSMIDLAAAVRTKQPGDQVSLTVVRDGDERTVEVTLGTQS